ncbi:MAG: DUF2147 domain-containing protein [Sphingobacteriaceae bacterium]|nr:DUF2147 domain-containing protein [Sphingobacteriaceae bacterium]
MRIKLFLFLVSLFVFTAKGYSVTQSDAIIGNWMSVRGNVKVRVYREGEEYKAKVLWFKDTDDKTKPMNTRTDENNPDPKLRQRKLIGLQVLSELKYNPKSKRWEGGKIYDAKTGKTWSSVAYFGKSGLLNVKGFWQFEFIGKTMVFNRSD